MNQIRCLPLVLLCPLIVLGWQRPAANDTTPAASSSERSPATPSFPDRTPRYKIGRGDVIEITFPRVPEFTQTVTVQPDGFITLKLVGDLYVVEHTVPELRDMLIAAYAKGGLHEPMITVELKDYEKPYFTAFGEVAKPGRYDLRGETTLMQALSISGGFRDTAKTSQVLLLRRVSSEWTELKKLDVKKMLASGNLKEDIPVQPGDIIFVPKSILGKIDRFIPNSSVGAMVRPY